MIPAKTHPEWKALLTDGRTHQFKFLALKFLMSRLQLQLKSDNSSANVQRCVSELHAFAIKHEKFVADDLAPVFR